MTNDNNDDLQIIAGESTVELSTGEQVTVREYRFLDGMRVDSLAGDLINDLNALFIGRDADQINLQDLAAILGRHADVTVELIAMACDRDADWVRDLRDADGQLIQLTWWVVNKDFFIRRLVLEAGARQIAKQLDQSSGEKSSPDSSATATG